MSTSTVFLSMRALTRHAIAALLFAGVGLAQATVLSFGGNFKYDDDIFTTDFTLTAPSAVVMRTFSWGGGTNGANVAIAAGGFAPVLSLFDTGGTQDLIAFGQAGGANSCGPGSVANGGACWDQTLQFVLLPAGTYRAVFTQDDNTPLGPSFTDGFHQGTGAQNDFTGPLFLGTPGHFISALQTERQDHWAFDIEFTEPAVTVPVPATGVLFALGLCLIGYSLRASSL